MAVKYSFFAIYRGMGLTLPQLCQNYLLLCVLVEYIAKNSI
jgi:hypothetical protein